MTEKRGYPTRAEAAAMVAEGERLNPGPWGDHSRVTAKCAEAIAAACGDNAGEMKIGTPKGVPVLFYR